MTNNHKSVSVHKTGSTSEFLARHNKVPFRFPELSTTIVLPAEEPIVVVVQLNRPVAVPSLR